MKQLTDKEEKFLQLMIEGKHTQRVAYREAFPHTVKWKDKTIDEKASRLFNSDKVKTRYNKAIEKHQKKAIMTRERLLEGYKKAFEMALGIEPTKTIIKELVDGNPQTIVNRLTLNVDLKAVAQIGDKIAKLEGWEKVETNPEPIQINISTPQNISEPYKDED